MRDLEGVWRQVEPRLRRIAAARGVPPDDRDDLVQEVAARVLTSRVTFESADDLLPWAATVLRRIHVDDHRRRERVELSPTPLTTAAHGRRARAADVADTADIAMARLDLAAITETVATWSPDARRILFDGGDSDGNGKGRHTGASYVRRHRLRARLLELIDGLSAWVAGRRYDTVYGELGAPIATHAPVAAAACLTAMLAVAGGFFENDGPSSPSSGEAPSQRPQPTLAATKARTAATSASDHAGDIRRPASAAAATKAPSPVGTDYGRADTAGSRFRSPVEHRAEVEAAGQRPSVYVENNEEPRPLSCFGGGEVPDTCIDSPVKLGDDLALPPI